MIAIGNLHETPSNTFAYAGTIKGTPVVVYRTSPRNKAEYLTIKTIEPEEYKTVYESMIRMGMNEQLLALLGWKKP